MHASRLAGLLFAVIFAASALMVAPVQSLTDPIPPPDFSIQVIHITYNFTSANETGSNGKPTVTYYNQAELQITFSSSVAVEYINNGYSLFYDIHYKDHSRPAWLDGWYTVFDEEDYPRQTGAGRAITANCTITYPSDKPNLDFQARIISTLPVTRWHYEKIDNKWVRVNQTVLQSAGSSEWSSTQTLTGLNGDAPVTPAPPSSTNFPTPTPSTLSPTATYEPSLIDGALPRWVQISIMAMIGIVGSVILMRGVIMWLKQKPATADSA